MECLDLTGIVMTYNNPALLSRCLNTMFHYAQGLRRLIVIDNSDVGDHRQSVDGICGALGWPIVEIRRYGTNDPNKNYAMAIDEAGTKYVAIMHDDLTFLPCCQNLWYQLHAVASATSVGMVGPSTDTADGFQNALRYDAPDMVKVHYLQSHCLMMRVDVFNELGGWAPIEASCIDMSIKMWQAGYDIVVNRCAYVSHRGGATYAHTTPGNFSALLLQWAEETHNELIQIHGVKTYMDYCSRANEMGMVMMTCGSGGFQAIASALSREPEPWTP